MSRKSYKTSDINLNQDADHVYYNLTLNNPTSSNALANFKENRSTTIIENPSEYTLSVVRFSLSKINLPIFFMNIFPKYSSSTLPWSSTATFILNQAVHYLGINYISLLSVNLGNQPNISPLAWVVSPNNPVPWMSTKSYSINDGVTYNSLVYVSLINGNIGNVPLSSPGSWAVTQSAPFLTHVCPNQSRYAVAMSYLGQKVTESIIYEPVDQTLTLPTNWGTVDQTNSQYYGVFIFSQFIEMINKALKSCYDQINVLSPPKVANVPAPYILFNPETLLISLVAHKTFDRNYVQTDTVELFFNTDLMSFFKDAMQYDKFYGYSGNSGLDFKLTIASRGDNLETLLYPDIDYPAWQSTLNYRVGQGTSYNNINYVSLTINFNKQPNLNPGDWVIQAQTPIPQTYSKTGVYALGQIVEYQGFYYINITGSNTTLPNGMDWNIYSGFDMLVMKGDYANLYNWIDIQSILFVSNLVPIVDEFVPTGNLNTTTTNSTLQIITDFVPDIQTGTDVNSNIVFFNQGEYRLTNMVSDTPMRSMNIQIYYTDRNNQLFPLYLEPFGFATCKLLFRKKSIKGGLTYNR